MKSPKFRKEKLKVCTASILLFVWDLSHKTLQFLKLVSSWEFLFFFSSALEGVNGVGYMQASGHRGWWRHGLPQILDPGAVILLIHKEVDLFLSRQSVCVCVCVCVYVCVCVSARTLSRFNCIRFFATPWIVSHQAHLPMGFSSKNTGVGRHALLLRGSSSPRGRKWVS